jgi:hypothetical protein
MKCCCKNTYHSLALDKDTLLDQIYAKPMTLKKKTAGLLRPHGHNCFRTQLQLSWLPRVLGIHVRSTSFCKKTPWSSCCAFHILTVFDQWSRMSPFHCSGEGASNTATILCHKLRLGLICFDFGHFSPRDKGKSNTCGSKKDLLSPHSLSFS